MAYDVVMFTSITRASVKTFGAYKCAHELRQAGYSVIVINFYEHFDIKELFKILKATVGANTLFVGFSNTFMAPQTILQQAGFVAKGMNRNRFLPHENAEVAEQMFAMYLNKLNPQTKIVVGGTRSAEHIGIKYVDYTVIGYADKSIVALADHLKNATPLPNSYKILGSKTTLVKDPLAKDFDFNSSTMCWTADDIVMPGETLPIELSRGCVFKCAFCNYRFNGKQTVDYIKPIETIKNELIYNWENYGITNYRILDDTFNDTEKKIDDMLAVVRDLPFSPKFWAYIRLDLLAKHPHTLDKLYEMGLRAAHFGIETLDLRAGRTIGKGFDPEKQVEMIRHIRSSYGNNMYMIGSFIVGLPGESMHSIVSTQQRILQDEIPLDDVQYWPLTFDKKDFFYWESTLSINLEKYGYQELQSSPDSERMNWQSPIMTQAQAIECVMDWTKKWNEKKKSNQQHLWFNNENIGTVEQIITNYKNQVFKYLSRSNECP